MIRPSVLIVEDEEDIRELVSYNLLKEGYRVTAVATGEEALAAATSQPPDLVLLDLMLPGLDGLTVCQRLKVNPQTRSVPVIILTVMSDEPTVVKGLNLGADDYITKPFSPEVLLARMRAVLRRTEGSSDTADQRENTAEAITAGDLAIHPGRHEAWLSGKPLELTPTEFQVLALLASKPGWVFTRQQILERLYGGDSPITPRAVDVQILGLRKKLGPAKDYIRTVRGVGYRFLE